MCDRAKRVPYHAQAGAAADALLVHLKHSELSDFVIPGKTLAYFAGGRPIIMACNGVVATLVREAGGW